eukprot:scaffold687_cov288-Chaetoceros_neogracile.AAC.19
MKSCAKLLLAATAVSFATICESKPAFKPQSSLALIHKNDNKNAILQTFTSPHKTTLQSIQQIQRGGADSGKSSLSTAMFNLVKGIVGVGVLSLPAGVSAFGDAQSAALPAIALISIMGSFSGYSFSLIGRICAYTGASSYSDAWEKSVGEESAWIPALVCSSMTFSAVLAYSMVLAETFQGIANSMGINTTRSQTLTALTAVVLYPLCSMKNLASLAPFSILGIIGMALTVVVMAIRFFDGSYALPAGKFLESVGHLPEFGSKGASAALSPNAIILVCMLSTAFMAHFNAPKFFNELENNTIARFNTLVGVSFGTAIAFFAAAASLGFATFGKASQGFILSNYSSKDGLIGISRIAVAFSLIFTYPLVFVGCRDGFLSLLKVPKEKQTDSYLNKLTIGLLTIVTLAAFNLKDLSFLMAFGGATLGNGLIYVFPALMFNSVVKNMGDSAPAGLKNETYFATFTMVLGLTVGVIGATMALKS